jgi:hypothetical protein
MRAMFGKIMKLFPYRPGRHGAVAVLGAVMLLVWASPVSAEKTDVIHLVNGDKVTGEIKRLQRGQLRYKTDSMSTIYVEWEDVVSLTSKDNFRVRLRDGRLFFGHLDAPADSFKTQVTTIDGPLVISHEEIVGILPIESTFWSRLEGSLSLGLSYSKASDIGTLNFDSRTSYQTHRNFVELKLSSNSTAQDGEQATQRHDLALNYERELSKQKWFATGSLGAEHNDELGLDLRLSASPGIGYRLAQTNHNLLSSTLGLSLNREWAADTSEATTNVEIPFTVGYSFFRYNSPKSDITSNLSVFPSLSTKGRIRLDFDVTLRHELVTDFFLELTFYDKYDSDPASGDAESNDWDIVTSIGWSY